MSKETTKTIDLEKFPYMNGKKRGIENRKELLDLLNKRKELIQTGWETLSAYEQNERKILLNKTEVQLANTHKQIHDLQIAFDQRTGQLIELLEEVDAKWDYIVERAKKLAEKNNELETYMLETDVSNFENNIEEKLSFYIKLRQFVNPSKNAMKIVKEDA